MAIMTIYGKILKNLPIQNREFCDLKTWHGSIEDSGSIKFV